MLAKSIKIALVTLFTCGMSVSMGIGTDQNGTSNPIRHPRCGGNHLSAGTASLAPQVEKSKPAPEFRPSTLNLPAFPEPLQAAYQPMLLLTGSAQVLSPVCHVWSAALVNLVRIGPSCPSYLLPDI